MNKPSPKQIREPLLSTPETLCKVDTTLFDEITDVLVDRAYSNHAFVWTPDHRSDYNPHSKKLVRIMGSFTERLRQYVFETEKAYLDKIVYTFDTMEVQPGKSQRGLRWHYDNDSHRDTLAVVAANTLPTEFLVAADDSPEAMDQGSQYIERLDPKSNGFQNAPIEVGLAQGALRLYHPQPYEAVIMTNHIHRSRLNESDQSVPRTWFRAALK